MRQQKSPQFQAKEMFKGKLNWAEETPGSMNK